MAFASISSLFSAPLRLVSLLFRAFSFLISFPLQLLSFLWNSNTIPWTFVITLLVVLISYAVYIENDYANHLKKHLTPCSCQCIHITSYNANGIKTIPIFGCLTCDNVATLRTRADKVLAQLRGKRNSHGAKAAFGLGLSALGHMYSGPIFDLFSGNGVGVGIKTARFCSVNFAVNKLKPFIRDVLREGANVRGCKCNGRSLSWAVSGLCDFGTGGAEDDTKEDEGVMDVDKEQLDEVKAGVKEEFVSELNDGGTIVEASKSGLMYLSECIFG